MKDEAQQFSLQGEGISVGYQQNIIIPKMDVQIPKGKITSIIGPNGCGKSTLLKAFSRMMPVQSGAVLLDGQAIATLPTVEVARKMAILPQSPQAPGGLTVEELVSYGRYPHQKGFGKLNEEDHRAIAWALEITHMAEFAQRGIDALSGGQRQRAWIAMALAQDTPLILLDEPNVLIMDEPGNDLDTDMLAVMEDLLDTWPGTLIVVSHDRYLLERVTDQQFALIGGKVRHLPGGVDDYLDMIEKAKTAAPAGVSASQKEPADSGVTATADDAPKLSGKEFRETSKRISAIERKLAKLEEQKTALEADMAAHDPSDYEGLNKLNGQLQAVSDESGALEAEWMELSEKLE